MKKISFSAVAVLLAGSLMCSSCIGSFSLFNGYEKWQCNMTSNKFVNGIVGLILQPIVGGICLFVDAVVLNTIEFWTGSNPMALNKVQTVKGQDGRYYAVKTLKDGYEVKAPNGEITLFTYNKKDNSWSMSQNGFTKEIFRFNEDGKSIKVEMNGETRDFTLNEQGVRDAEFAACNGLYFAAR